MVVVWIQIFKTKAIPKEKAPYNFLLLIMLDSVIKAKKKYYPQRKAQISTKHDIK